MGRTRKILGISLVGLFVMSLLVMAVSAQPNGDGGKKGGGIPKSPDYGIPKSPDYGIPNPPTKAYGIQQEKSFTQEGKKEGKTFSGDYLYYPKFCYRCCWYWDYFDDQWRFRCSPYYKS